MPRTHSLKASSLRFLDRRAAREIGAFDLGGYSSFTKIVWSPKSDFVAVQTHFTRHTFEFHLFHVDRGGLKKVLVEDYHQNIFGRFGVLNGRRGSVDEPLRWLDASRLPLSSMGTFDGLEYGYNFEVEISAYFDGDDYVGRLEALSPVKEDK